MKAQPGPRLIRRYDNRKLYDVGGGTYVTLEHLRERVCRGEEILILDRKTGEDLTSLTLAQILLEGLRARTARIPRPLLVRLVRLSAGPGTHVWPTPGEAAHLARAEAEKIAGGLLAQGRLSLEEAMALRQEIVHSVGGLVAEVQAGLEAGLHRWLGDEDGAPTRRRAPATAARHPRSRPRPRGRTRVKARRIHTS